MNEKKRKNLIPVIDSKFQPCYPTTPDRARFLLNHGIATVYSFRPFIIRLVYERREPVNEYTENITRFFMEMAKQKNKISKEYQ